jgi:antitoxin (DNA-binding transcriptional repressor) of toxin-antitoxin stability system
MQTMTATEVNRNFRRVLDALARNADEIVVLRNRQPVARLLPGSPRMTAIEALSDLYRTLNNGEGDAWLRDSRTADRAVRKEMRDPWA